MSTLKHTCIRDFFRVIDTEPKAYWLGFLYADGYVFNRQPNGFRLSLQRRDAGHIAKLKEAMNASQAIDEYMTGESKRLDGRVIKPHPQSSITIYGKDIAEDLIRAGCGPNKTKRLIFPTTNQVPNHLTNHFIRGFFDGDGTIFTTKDGGSNAQLTYTVGFIGQPTFITAVRDIVANACDLNKNALRDNSGCIKVTWGGNRVVDRIGAYLYANHTVCLDRKKVKFDECLARPEFMIRDERHHLATTYSFRREDGTRLDIKNMNHFGRLNPQYSTACLRRVHNGKQNSHRGLSKWTEPNGAN